MEFTVQLDLPTEAAQKSLQRFIGRLPHYNGNTLDVSPALPEKLVKSRKIVPVEVSIVDPSTLPSHLLARTEFNEIAHCTTSQNHATQTWQLATTNTHSYGRKDYVEQPVLDLDKLLWRMRDIESGQKHDSSLVTEKRWNLLSGFINDRLRDPGDSLLMLPWDELIHLEFRKWNDARRLQAAQLLADKYSLVSTQATTL